ncbi:hypothetical protein E1B28_002860 [Marasmius oreades]|uniref:Uncharacterized protein n=1 Tax=Marasmius oreades TaxID=181124 RepID=A0A9P7UM31_9AGAR|nr:uncharacterized protein E1B28_002860 [Marasmius oreades]KAG7086943.1 hypothetical protein E1B28_002860 [Marasmius oreades]
MIAGIVVQVTTMTVFIVLISEYAFRYVNNMPLRRTTKDPASHHSPLDTRRQILLFALVITTLLLFIRAIYRLVELGGGWSGKVAQTEWFFNVFEAGLVTLAFFIWNVAHPSLLLEEHTPENYNLNVGLKQGNSVGKYRALTDWQTDYSQ